MIRVTLTGEKTSLVFFSNSELCWQCSFGSHRRSHLDQGETPERITLRGPAYAFRRSSIHRGICLAGIGRDSVAPGVADMAAAYMLYAQGLLPFLLPLSVLLFEPDVNSRRRMLPFLVLGGATSLYILWALMAYPLQVSVRENSIGNQSGHQQHSACSTVCDCNLRLAVCFKSQADGRLRRGQPHHSSDCDGG